MASTYDFSGKVVVVTGGGSGIGAGLCREISAAGGISVCTDVDGSRCEAVVASDAGKGSIAGYQLDVCDSRAVDSLFGEILDRFGRIDGLVLSAAIQPRRDIADMSDSDWQRVLDTNLSGVFYCVRSVLDHFKERREGSIITFSSGLALQGWQSTSAYAATKAGLIGFTKSLARELLPYNVRANVVHPGITDSPLFTETKTPEEMEHFTSTGGAMGTVEDVVQFLMFLLSDLSSSWTGLFVSRDLIFPPGQGRV